MYMDMYMVMCMYIYVHSYINACAHRCGSQCGPCVCQVLIFTMHCCPYYIITLYLILLVYTSTLEC